MFISTKMNDFFNKMNIYGKFWINNTHQTWTIRFEMNITNGSKLEISCDDKETLTEAVDGLIDKMKAMDITIDGVKFEDFIK